MKNPKTLRDIIFRITRIILGLRFETDFFEKMFKKNLDNYIYIYICAAFCKTKSGHITLCANYIKHLSDSGTRTLHHRDLLAVDDVPTSYYLPIEPVIYNSRSGAAGTSLSFYEGKHRKSAYELCKAGSRTNRH